MTKTQTLTNGTAITFTIVTCLYMDGSGVVHDYRVKVARPDGGSYTVNMTQSAWNRI